MKNKERGRLGYIRDINQDYGEYRKGQIIRELTVGPDILPNGGGGLGKVGIYLGVVAFIIAFFPFVLLSSIASLFLAFFLKIYLGFIEVEHKKLRFLAAFKIMFVVSILYEIIFSVTSIGGIMFYKHFSNSIFGKSNGNIFSNDDAWVTLFLITQIPIILIAAIFLRKMLTYFSKFNGFSGYLRSVFFMTIAISTTLSAIIFATIYILGVLKHHI